MAEGFHADGAAVNLDRPEGGPRAAGGRLTAALAAYNEAMRWGREVHQELVRVENELGWTSNGRAQDRVSFMSHQRIRAL